METIAEYVRRAIVAVVFTALIPVACQFHPTTKDRAIQALHYFADMVDKIEVGDAAD